MLEIASLLIGTVAIQKQAPDVLNRNPASNLFGFNFDAGTPESPILHDCAVELQHLKENILEYHVPNQCVKKTLNDAVDDMIRAMKNTGKPRVVPSTELTVVFMWPPQVSHEYIALLKSRHPAALAILLYYCVMLKSMESEFWLLKGWGPSLSAIISDLLIESPWTERKAWPLTRVFEKAGWDEQDSKYLRFHANKLFSPKQKDRGPWYTQGRPRCKRPAPS